MASAYPFGHGTTVTLPAVPERPRGAPRWRPAPRPTGRAAELELDLRPSSPAVTSDAVAGGLAGVGRVDASSLTSTVWPDAVLIVSVSPSTDSTVPLMVRPPPTAAEAAAGRRRRATPPCAARARSCRVGKPVAARRVPAVPTPAAEAGAVLAADGERDAADGDDGRDAEERR